MQYRLAYGKTGLSVTLPDNLQITVVEPHHVPALPDPSGAVREALEQPIGTPPLRVQVRATDRVGIVFSDITRPTPNGLLLPVLRKSLAHVPDDNIILFNATGTHRFNTDVELRGMLGDALVDRHLIVQNDAADAGSHAVVGTTTSGNEIAILDEFLECDVKVLTGFIEPHFFAGFSGGGKAVMPGLASLDTVMRNHCARNIDHPQARWGVTRGNPIWEEAYEAAKMTSPTFLLNVTLNREKEITGVFAGELLEAHAKGCEFVRDSAMVPVDAPFDIVIGTNSGYPLDLNLYQSVKGMSAAAQVVKPGGSIIIAAECWDGIPNHGEYARLLQSAESLESLLAAIRAPGYARQDMWQAHVQALVCGQADVYLHTRNLAPEQITRALLKPCASIEQTVLLLLEKYGEGASICILPEGPQTVPYVREAVTQSPPASGD
ncbi:MAG: nickel-dependent lactate racemase [Armatimonadota bacterium]